MNLENILEKIYINLGKITLTIEKMSLIVLAIKY